MNQRNLFFFLMILLIAGAGCSTTKSVPPNDRLYTGASVTVTGPDLTSRQKKTLRNDLQGLTRPRPNSRFLGIPFKLNIYNLFANAKPNSFFGKLRNKLGEPPVLLSQLDLEQNEKVLQSFLENKGFFHARVTGDTTVKGRKAKATYEAAAGNQYRIASVTFPEDSSELARAIRESATQSLLQVGRPFDLDVIRAERIRIDAFLKERGFYFFNPEHLLVQTDSTIGNHSVAMYVVKKPEMPDSAGTIYRINDVYIYSNYSLATARLDTNLQNAERYRGYTIIDRRKRYKPRLLEENMQFHPGEVYNRVDHNQTLSRLVNLNLFKFVKNRFEVAAADSPKLDAYYYLTPLPSKTLRAEVTAISRSNNLNGSQISLSWLNRNLFRNGTQLNFTAYVGSDIQFSGALRGYNTYRTGAEITLAMPRIVMPFVELRPKGPFAPRTTIRVGYDILNRKGLYTLNSYRFQYGYIFKKNLQTQHEFNPISITYVQPLNVTRAYDSLKNIYVGLDNAIQRQFILGGSYQYTFNGLAAGQQTRNAYYFNGLLDVSGNIAGLISGANVKRGDTAKIANTPFSQYVKLELDGRHYRRIGIRSTWVNRLNIGFGLPYGNSVQVPYVKQFFVGGNNSLRGFRSRSVGPGVYLPERGDIIPDQTGDIKLEFNTEFRPHISGPLYGAIFLEAGNIWLFNDSTYTRKPGAKFTSRFLSQLAVDAGVGIRLDIQVFVIRLDVGFPLRKPWERDPWVINQINFGSRQWRQENLIYNLAIGYPF
jgi:outer membrane protein insertion porin family